MPRDGELTKAQVREQVYNSLQNEGIDRTANTNAVAVDKLREIAQENTRVNKVDDAAYDKNAQGSRQVQLQVNLISEALKMDEKNKGIMLAPKTKERLKVTKGRKTSQLLLNSTRKYAWWDSEEMTDIKNKLKELEDFLARDRSWEEENGTVIPKLTDDELREVELKYESAIRACNYYLAVKTTKTGTGRYTLVRDKMLSLMEELSQFTSMRTIIKADENPEWTGVRTYADLLWSFSIHNYVDRLVGVEPASEKVKKNEREAEPVQHNVNKDAMDPAGRLFFELLCLEPVQSLVGDGEDKLDQMRMANYLLNVLQDLQQGPKAFYFHSAFAGYKGKDVARKYRDNNGDVKPGNTFFELIHRRNGKFVMAVNGTQVELPGIQTVIADIRNKIIMSEGALNRLHEEEPDKYAENLGTNLTKSVLKFALDADYEKNEAPEGFRDSAIQAIQSRYKGMDQSRFYKIKDEDLRKLLNKALYKNMPQDRMAREIAILNNEKYWTDEVYAGREVREEDVPKKDDKEALEAFKKNALSYLTSVTYMAESMFDQMSVLDLHKLAMQLMNRETNPDLVKSKIRSDRGGKYYVEVKGDAGKYINSKDARDVLKRWNNRNKDIKTVEFNEQVQEQEANPKELTWTQEEKQIKDFISNLIFSGDAGAADLEVENGLKGAQFKRLVANPESIHALALMLKNDQLLTATLTRIPFIANPAAFAEKVLLIFKNWLVFDQSNIDVTQPVERIAERITQVIENREDKLDIQAEDQLGKLIDGFSQDQINSIQTIIDEMLRSNFGGAQQMPKEPASSKEDGIPREEKKRRLVEERKWLTEYLKQQVTTGNEGQAKFLKEVLGHYFANIATMDQRSVIAFMLREAKPSVKNGGEKDKEKAAEDLRKSKESCLAGMIKGAGPLLQKTMQGVPTEGIPSLLKYAIEDTRSRLLPISKEYVQAQLHELVVNSDNKISKIVITRSLGAASVGQAFLVKVYGPGMAQEGVTHVVKILRPDAANRMEREKAIFEQCAKEVDGEGNTAMQVTFRNIYQRINQELSFENEVANARKGKRHYDTTQVGAENDDHVHSMNISNLTKSSKNVMLIELAPGKTVDQDTTDIENEIYNVLHPAYRFSETKKLMYTANAMNASPLFYKNVIEKLTPLLASTQKKQEHLISLAEKWLEESIFSAEGFYHGDLHAGNIMLDENGATVIDYGNATTLSKMQQENLVKLVATAGGGLRVADKFIEAFEALLYEDNQDESLRDKFGEKRAEFKEKVEKILDMGDDSDAVLRMSILASEAQQMGFPLPTAIANYLQCQMRFKNTIEAYNKLITDMQDAIRIAKWNVSTIEYEDLYSMKLFAQNFMMSAKNEEGARKCRKYTQRVMAKWYAKESDLSAMLDDTTEEGQKAFSDVFIGEDMGEIPAKLSALRDAQRDQADEATIARLKKELMDALNEDFAQTVTMSDEEIKAFCPEWGEDEDGGVTHPFSAFKEEFEILVEDASHQKYRLENLVRGWRNQDISSNMTHEQITKKVVDDKNDPKLTKAYYEFKEKVDIFLAGDKVYTDKRENMVEPLAAYKKLMLELIRVEMPEIKELTRTPVVGKEYSKDAPTSFMAACGGVVRSHMTSVMKLFGPMGILTMTRALYSQAQRLGEMG